MKTQVYLYSQYKLILKEQYLFSILNIFIKLENNKSGISYLLDDTHAFTHVLNVKLH